ncbi:hypothetical protein SS50377_21441 [Spironucleus salmonicida]|uniref:Uncharacterized protein n=1 Tax=Spironucleus salmonicida TaxID=348837 RepID=V6LFF3_9EUKA|nr:hypothetical protein SS50377_21441 [Spironucleus salmonicida]|eukprot:EST42436.1 Hypothetical protein SS50377_17997 [Spironucleus salmonicida]
MQQTIKYNILTRTGAAVCWSGATCLCTICSAFSIRRTIEQTILGSPPLHPKSFCAGLCACGVRDFVQKGIRRAFSPRSESVFLAVYCLPVVDIPSQVQLRAVCAQDTVLGSYAGDQQTGSAQQGFAVPCSLRVVFRFELRNCSMILINSVNGFSCFSILLSWDQVGYPELSS